MPRTGLFPAFGLQCSLYFREGPTHSVGVINLFKLYNLPFLFLVLLNLLQKQSHTNFGFSQMILLANVNVVLLNEYVFGDLALKVEKLALIYIE